VEAGYEREETIEGKGQFALRGGILDIAPHDIDPIRIEFFDEEVDSIRIFDLETQKSLGNLDEVLFVPVHEYVISAKEQQGLKWGIKARARKAVERRKRWARTEAVNNLKKKVEYWENEMNEVLHQQIYGHLGCHADGVTYVVPISYAYDGQYIYAHSRKGMKMTFMEKNPQVCFQVDVLENMGNWRSVIAWGSYEALSDVADRKKAIEILLQRHAPPVASQTVQLGHEWPFTSEHLESIGGVVFRILIKEKTGRFEHVSAPAYFAS